MRNFGGFQGQEDPHIRVRLPIRSAQAIGRDAGRDDPGDVLPALQQGAIDGAIAGITVFSAFHYQDAAKYITEINQPAIFLMIEISKTWYNSLPPDLQKVIDKDAAAESVAINPAALALFNKARETWTASGGELISLSPADQAKFMQTIASVGEDVSRPKPGLHDAYEIVAEAAKRTAQGATQ